MYSHILQPLSRPAQDICRLEQLLPSEVPVAVINGVAHDGEDGDVVTGA
jgi:hypothetical protein